MENYDENESFAKLYDNVYVVIYNFYYPCNNRIAEYLKLNLKNFITLHKIIYAQQIKDILYCINIYGSFILFYQCFPLDLNKEIIYSKEKKLSFEYINKYIKSNINLYDRYHNLGITPETNIFVLEQRIEQTMRDNINKNDEIKKIIDELVKKIIYKIGNYNDELMHFLMKNVSSENKYIDLYKYYIYEYTNYIKKVEKFKKYLLEFIDNGYKHQNFLTISYSDDNMYNYIIMIFTKIFNKIKNKDLPNTEDTFFNLEKEWIMNQHAKNVVSKILDYDKLLKVGIKNPYFVFNKNK